MSVLSQFFPQGGGAEGFIDVQALIVAGGGGGGATSSFPNRGGGGGGGGGVFYGFISVKLGSTCPIVIGAGGAGGAPGPGGSLSGFLGSDSSVTTPVRTISVMGGGGGCAGNVTNHPQSVGGCGGGTGFAPGSTILSTRGVYTHETIDSSQPTAPYIRAGTNKQLSGFYGANTIRTPGEPSQPAMPGGGAGTTNGNLSFICDIIAGITTTYSTGGSTPTPAVVAGGTNTGNGGSGTALPPAAGSGGSGAVILRYPTQFGAASFTPSPAVTDLTPSTSPFGYRTYKFTASASITFP